MPQYFEEQPQTESCRRIVDYRMNGINFNFTTDTAVFSRSNVDFGTNLLISAMIEDIRKTGPHPGNFSGSGMRCRHCRHRNEVMLYGVQHVRYGHKFTPLILQR